MMLDLPELRYLDQVAQGAQTVFRSSSIAAQQAALASGIGLGVLPVFLAGKTPELVRVMEDELTLTRSYWLSMHADSQRILRIRAVVEFLQGLVTTHRAEL